MKSIIPDSGTKSNHASVLVDGVRYDFEPFNMSVTSDMDGYEFTMRAWNLVSRTEEEMISKEEAQASFGCVSSVIQPNIYPYPDFFPNTRTDTNITVTTAPEPKNELYKDDLKALVSLLDHVEKIANNEAVFDLEIRVKLFSGDVWAVLGYGEAGDPAVLRFEK